MDEKIDEFVLVHHFGVIHRYQETYIIARKRFSPQNHKILSSLTQKLREFAAKDFFHVVRLLHADAHSDGIY